MDNDGTKSRLATVAVALVAVIAAIFQLTADKKPCDKAPAPLTYYLFGKNVDSGHLKHVEAVLNRLGVERTRDLNGSWDLLWGHDYPFTELKPLLTNLESYRRVNHFPGNGHITSKVDLAVSENPYIPRAFQLPKDKEAFLAYSHLQPERQFVQKNNQHRDIFVRGVDEIDFSDADTFLQEFIVRPLLVDGHKFDIGVYVIITSIQPLRIYIYKGEILFRYCPKKYHPFDPLDQDKYVVGDRYLPSWKIPALERYHELGFGMKAAFDAYIRHDLKKDPDLIWQSVEDAIVSIILQKEQKLIEAVKQYSFRSSFFEMMRIDLIVDENLKVWLLEANMSPNLSSAKFPPNAIIYEQLLYNMFKLLGIGSAEKRESFNKLDTDSEIMISSVKHLVVEPELCNSPPCSESCAAEECNLCLPCLNSYQLFDLHAAYREHVNRGDTKRIFPKPLAAESLVTDHLSPKNAWMTRWFAGKCKLDVTFCT